MCHDYPPLTGGGLAAATRDLATLVPRGVEVRTVTSRLEDHFGDDRADTGGAARVGLVGLWRSIRTSDVVIIHWTFSFRWLSCLALLLAPIARRTTCCVVHTAPAHLEYNRLRRVPAAVRRRLPRLAAGMTRLCYAVVALSPGHAQAMRVAAFPPTRVLPVPVYPPRGAEAGPVPRRRVADSGGLEVLGFAGELSQLKGADALPALIRHTVPEFGFWVAGRGPLGGAVREGVAALDAPSGHRVALTDRLSPEQMSRFFSGVDAVLLCSRSESQSRLALEAMLSEVIVLCRPVEGLRDLVDDGRTGFYIDPDRPRDVLRTLRRLRADPGALRRVRTESRETALSRVGAADVDWRQMFEELLLDGRRREAAAHTGHS